MGELSVISILEKNQTFNRNKNLLLIEIVFVKMTDVYNSKIAKYATTPSFMTSEFLWDLFQFLPIQRQLSGEERRIKMELNADL